MGLARMIKIAVVLFILLTAIIAALFWLYLNIQASMYVDAQKTKIALPAQLPTKIHVGNHLDVHSKGKLDTEILIDRQLKLPLKGRYLADIEFKIETPITVNIDYETMVKIDQVMPVETTTDLVYQSRFLPEFPLKLDIPVRLDVPFHLKRSYTVPIQIHFKGPVYFEFDEFVNLPVKHKFAPSLEINDPMTMRKIAHFKATMYNENRETEADLKMNIQLPVKNIHP